MNFSLPLNLMISVSYLVDLGSGLLLESVKFQQYICQQQQLSNSEILTFILLSMMKSISKTPYCTADMCDSYRPHEGSFDNVLFYEERARRERREAIEGKKNCKLLNNKVK
ncbi:hypothetical protein Dimus_012341 [Dionaea muscipula]